MMVIALKFPGPDRRTSLAPSSPAPSTKMSQSLTYSPDGRPKASRRTVTPTPGEGSSQIGLKQSTQNLTVAIRQK